MIEEIRVLDHGSVRLVDSMGDDLSIVRNARVSYDAEWRAGKDKNSDTRLIHYLYKNGHNTPFEAVTATFDIRCPIFVARQWHRHRTQSYNEISARYRELPDVWYVPEVQQITTQAADNKQMRTTVENPMAKELKRIFNRVQKYTHREYKVMLEEGCPRELARMILPLGTYTHFFATANLHNWMRFLAERMHPHAQYEIRVYADAVHALLRHVAPVAMDAFAEKYLNADDS